ncbi:MAG: hypothetical protein IJJ69_09815 [Oscillospiraceae bacterium]|nr:hypothetical protein [Oscillospiraceae bacterium]
MMNHKEDKRIYTLSQEAQVSYYTDYIQKHDDWELYADEGLSGCSTAKREEFKKWSQMLLPDASIFSVFLRNYSFVVLLLC